MANGGWSWHGAVALTLAITLGVVLVIISGPWDPDPLSPQGAQLLTGILATLAVYLGASLRFNGRPKPVPAARVDETGPADWRLELGSDQRMSSSAIDRVIRAGRAADIERERTRARRGE